jgi:cell division protein FtsW (lipid II flippase)
MDPRRAVRTFDFPLQLDQAEIENRCARESFTWGPQTLWLLCGLIWLFYLLVRDIPELARNTALFGVGATVPAALAVWYEMRRRRRQAVLCPLRGRIGCYRGNRFQYSFLPEEMVRVRPDVFGLLMIVFKLLIPMFLLMVIVALVMFDSLKQSHQVRFQDFAIFVYAMLFALFGFVALFRSHLRLASFWIPNGKGKTNTSLYLHPRELRKIEEGDARAIR